MHTLTSVYDRWRTKLLSVMAEANPRVSASSQHPYPSSSIRTQQKLSTAAPALHDEPLKIPKLIPNSIPKADALFESHTMAGNAELLPSAMQQESAVEGFMNLVTEDDDNLELQRQRREEEEQKIEDAQGELTLCVQHAVYARCEWLVDCKLVNLWTANHSLIDQLAAGSVNSKLLALCSVNLYHVDFYESLLFEYCF